MASSPKLEDLPHLSTTEWRVFSVLSRQTETATIRQIEAALLRQSTLEPLPTGTILVLVQRLIKKGYASHKPLKGTNAHVYWAIHSYDSVLRRQATRLVAELALGDPETLQKLRTFLSESELPAQN